MIRKILIVLFGLYLILLVGFYLTQDKIFFQASALKQDHTFSFDRPFKEVNLTSADNTLINALHFKVEDPKGIVLYFHGNRGNLERWGKLVAPFNQKGYDVFVMDYRGYGKSKGERKELRMYQDASLAYEYLSRQYTDKEIVIYGRSLGCTFATHVAAVHKPRALILEAPFYSLTDVVKSKFAFLPYKYLLKYKFETSELIPSVEAATVIFHGTDDRLIPISSGKRLYERSNKENTKFVTLDKGTHHNLATYERYQEELNMLLK